jgi:hypothetical protein
MNSCLLVEWRLVLVVLVLVLVLVLVPVHELVLGQE